MSSLVTLPAGPVHWILDWDGTLTKRDTLNALVNIAARCKPDSPVLSEWNRVSEAYIADHDCTLNAQAPNGRLPTTVSDEKALLRILEKVEQRSVDRVSASGIFGGLTLNHLDSEAAKAVQNGEVQLREGCSGFLDLVHYRNGMKNDVAGAVSILSVNWSRRFIAACLRAAHVDPQHPILASIYANELEGNTQHQSTSGRICVGEDMKIISSRDKLDCLEALRKDTLRNGKMLPIVYVGDSGTDFECLLAADLGISIRDDPITSTQKKLADALKRVGAPCVHLSQIQEEAGAIAWVKDFREIAEWASKWQ